MHSLHISKRIDARFDPDDKGITVRAGCPVCQGPLLLAACLGLNPAGPAQHIYRCATGRSLGMPRIDLLPVKWLGSHPRSSEKVP